MTEHNLITSFDNYFFYYYLLVQIVIRSIDDRSIDDGFLVN